MMHQPADAVRQRLAELHRRNLVAEAARMRLADQIPAPSLFAHGVTIVGGSPGGSSAWPEP